VLPTFRRLAADDDTKRFWLCWNELNADELLSIVDSNVYDSSRDEEFKLSPTEIGLSGGTFDELKPVDDLDQTVSHFLGLIGGDGPRAAIESIKLNAGALAINCEVASDWPEALDMADRAMRAGEPARLIERMREHGKQASTGPTKAARG
jgi:anthranilate phosphoribosyltransferase